MQLTESYLKTRNSATFHSGRGSDRAMVFGNFQCQDVLLIWSIVGQGPIVLAVGAGGANLGIFSLDNHFSFLSPSETARFRLKYCHQEPFNPNHPTNNVPIHKMSVFGRCIVDSIFQD